MINIEKGGIYPAERFRSGTSSKGRWEMLTVLEQGKRIGKENPEVTVFPASVPTGLAEGDMFRVKEILSVQRKKRKDSLGNWTLTNVNIVAEVEKLEEAQVNLAGENPFDPDAYDDSDDLDGTASLDDLPFIL